MALSDLHPFPPASTPPVEINTRICSLTFIATKNGIVVHDTTTNRTFLDLAESYNFYTMKEVLDFVNKHVRDKLGMDTA